MVSTAQNLTSRHSDWLNCVAYTFFSNNQKEKAVLLWKAVLDSEPNNVYAARSLCQAYLLTGKPDKAVSLGEKWASSSEVGPKILLILSQAFLAMGDHDEARYWARKYVESNR